MGNFVENYDILFFFRFRDIYDNLLNFKRIQKVEETQDNYDDVLFFRLVDRLVSFLFSRVKLIVSYFLFRQDDYDVVFLLRLVFQGSSRFLQEVYDFVFFLRLILFCSEIQDFYDVFFLVRFQESENYDIVFLVRRIFFYSDI